MLDPRQSVPGVYQQDILAQPEPSLLTGVPVFLGYAGQGPGAPALLSLWPQFAAAYGPPPDRGYLAHAVRGFFANGGLACYVVPLDPGAEPQVALRAGLELAAALDDADLVCAPDLSLAPAATGATALDTLASLQRDLLDHCRRLGDRFAILDAPLTPAVDEVLELAGRLTSSFGALYYGWAQVRAGAAPLLAPPCGHVAGVYAAGDLRVGVHQAPANVELEEVLDVRYEPLRGAPLGAEAQRALHEGGVNTIRPFHGRGIRVWGARTLADEPEWRYVSVRRLFLTVARWLGRFLVNLAFEPNSVSLWARIVREVGAYLEQLYRQGALAGVTAAQAFYVKCDAETNSPEVIAAGQVVTEIGLAPAVPGEFIVARIVHGASGVSVSAV